MYLPDEEKYLSTKDELLAQLRGILGGRAAEQVVFGVQTNGASNDIQQATSLARHMVSLYGMSEELGLMATASIQSQYLDGQAHMDCSQETASKVDMAVQNLLNQCYEDAKRTLVENRNLLNEISEYLLAKETITGDELMAYVKAAQKEESEAPEAESAE
jgi:cell division protease FtsH